MYLDTSRAESGSRQTARLKRLKDNGTIHCDCPRCQLQELTCEGGPHGEVVVVDAQEVAGLHLSGFGSIRNLLRQRTDDGQMVGQRDVGVHPQRGKGRGVIPSVQITVKGLNIFSDFFTPDP